MAIDYVAISATAKRLIEENGRACTFFKMSRDPADASKPWRGPASPGTTNPEVALADVIAVITPEDYSVAQGEVSRRPRATVLVAHDSFVAAVVAPAVLPDITTLDRVNDGTRYWNILKVSPIMPGATPIIYQMIVEG